MKFSSKGENDMSEIRNKIITISGEPRSGKSTVVKEIVAKYQQMGFNVHVVETGALFRQISEKEYLKMYPDKTAKERENLITKKYGAVFIMGIGSKLSNGEKHDGRAPDYDDWSTPNSDGFAGLNGDILVWDNILDQALELSSMGIRVNKESLENQLTLTGQEARKQFYYHKRLLEGSLPLTMGGGIGQSRLCMFMLRKAHVGEIQASIWPQEMRKMCKENGINLL